MQTLVPRIRAGEVLRGTRNLRHWLRTASILYNLENLHRNSLRFTDPSLAKSLYAPQKDDSFVVAANTPFHFCVWSARQNISLVFINPHGKYLQETSPSYMSPGLFATWFVRTNEYNLDLSKWPHYAYYMWAVVQMNVSALFDHDYTLNLSRHYIHPFLFSQNVNNAEVRNSVAECVKQAARRGRLRAAGLKVWHTRRYGTDYTGYGPHLRQIQSMQSNIKNYLSNPRSLPGPKSKFSNEVLEQELLKVLQRYKENPEAGIEAALKNYL